MSLLDYYDDKTVNPCKGCPDYDESVKGSCISKGACGTKTNAQKFYEVFGIYSEEFWSMPEEEMLKFINSEYGKGEKYGA